jgi:hypothetical protein
VYNSFLTWGYVLMRAGREEEAEVVYLEIINSPLPGGINEKAFAHISLGGILNSKGQPVGNKEIMREAIYHYERGLRYIRDTISPKDHRIMLQQLIPLYESVRDLPGLAYCVKYLGKSDVESILKKEVTPDKSIEDIISLNTRLHALGEYDLADLIFEGWRQLQTGAKTTQGDTSNGERDNTNRDSGS